MLSSGQFVAHPSPHDNKIPIIDREGSQKEIALDRTATSCTIDPLTDDLYPVYWDKTRKACVVDHLSSTGELKATNVLEYTPVYDRVVYSPFIMTTSKRLVLCDGRDCRVYKYKM